ncbi:MAG: M20/M25/M40 family metallo-hydrolase [Chloroflexi bacterium]|nr:M20/M25/M40 family metallo-hydrolase [Chloroflexota bacterium]
MPNLLSEIDARIERNLERSIDELSRLCAQPSISTQGVGVRECAELVAEMLRQRGFRAAIHPTPGHPVVIGEAAGRSGKTLLFYNHYDVQPPEPLELWNSPPFEPTVRDGKLFARGVSDDKGHIACRLAAIDAIKEVSGELPCNIKFIIEGEEEMGSPSLPAFIESHAEELKADACIWETGGVNFREQPSMVLGMRGICYVELSVQCLTQDVHSGLGGSIFPNAAWRLVWALSAIKDSRERVLIPGFYDDVEQPTARDMELLANLPDSSGDMRRRYGVQEFLKGLQPGTELRREAVMVPTCTISGLTAGYQAKGTKTVLPARASAKVDFRLVPHQSPDDIVEKLRKHLQAHGFGDVQVELLSGEKPARTDPDHPFIKLVADTALEVYDQEMSISPMAGGSGPNHAFVHYLHVPIGSAGVSYPGSQVHAPNENMRLDLFVKGAQHTAHIIQRFAM